jgi:glycosyltransferase involved in cell wall biosynthesis
MSFVLRVLLVPSKGIYFHITHDLNRRTKRWLGLVERIFTRLVFICPATYQDFASRSLKSMWAPQSSELHGIETNAVLQRKRERRAATPLRISVGLSGRLTREKGAEVIVDFIRNCRQPCDFHIAGTGPFARDFETLAARSSERGPRVFFHGSYSPANRIGFLRGFFGEIDWLLVPSIDEWETLSMVTLEALQHGTPVLCSRAGGLRSFGMDELGPVSESIIKLVLPKDFSYRLSEIVAGPAFNLEERFTECSNYYASYFSDQRVFGRWKQIID